MFPRQLCFLANALDGVRDVPGGIVEIGCAHGLTTTFLYEYMTQSGFKKDYLCIDMFDGFTEGDLSHEFDERGNSNKWISGLFKDNDAQWFKESLAKRSINDVRIIKGDISALPTDALPEKIAFCLLDVDLYKPVQSGLQKVWERLSPGGIIVVDDCWVSYDRPQLEKIAEAYDGALAAYREFVKAHGLPEEVVEMKLGVIRKPL
ncbi:TylF/MycF/NovP-related O-methyltransferase [Sphingomonas sp. LHG3443-2]|uniref:TylF/MycF/NovP-related O-methyltransferase n=1 Tax=Sphingomonas sp. LHG3443-2 TaxID=2804639 RepID=UPI003CF3DA6D